MMLIPRARMVRAFVSALWAPRAQVSRLTFTVRWFDCDLNLHLTNARYFQLMDAGRLDLVTRSGTLRRMVDARLSPTLVEVTTRFRRELAPGQRFTLDTRMVGLAGKAALVEQHFLVGARVHARAQARVMLVHRGRAAAPDLLAPLQVEPLALDVDGRRVLEAP